MIPTACIDADYIVYKNCAAAEFDIDYGSDIIVVGSHFSDAYNGVVRDIERIKNDLCINDVILFFSDSENFRKEVDPSYKGHRNRKKPCGYVRVMEKLAEDYPINRMPRLEADDAIGIYATLNPGCIIISPDKDMKQIPGTLYNLDETFTISEEDGYRWFLIQTLSGDSTDGYSGAPGFGVKTSTKWFEKHGYTWDSVVKAFESKGLTKDDAIHNARLAKILTVDDYDNGPVLYAPDAHSNSNSRTRVQVTQDGDFIESTIPSRY